MARGASRSGGSARRSTRCTSSGTPTRPASSGCSTPKTAQDTFAALLGTAEQWLRDQGMRRVRGPFSLSINEETGLLIEGFDTPPVFMMGHARPYYASARRGAGLSEGRRHVRLHDRRRFRTVARHGAARGRRRETRARARRSTASASTPRSSSCGTSSTTPGRKTGDSCPSPPPNFTNSGRNLRFLVDPGLIRIAEVDGEPAAFIVVIPNINEAIRGLDGRLLPFGWAKLLWRLKVRHPVHRARAADGRAAQVSALRASVPRSRSS